MSLFNAADVCISPYINEDIFNESLLLNILFQEKILFHKSFYFDSDLLAKHLSGFKGEISLFDAATREGVIVPAFRNKSISSLDDAEKIMTQDDVYGKNYKLLKPFMKPHISNLKASVDECLKHHEAFYWPQDRHAAMEYYNSLRMFLQSETFPDYIYSDATRLQLFSRVWEKSSKWRYESIEKAYDRSVRKGANGLQRADLFWVIGQDLGFSTDKITITVQDLINSCDGAEQKLALEIFLKWSSQCHHIGQAKAFEASINFPVYNLESDFILDSLLRSPSDAAPPATEGFRCEVFLPNISELLNFPSNELIAIRNDLGRGYMRELKNWNSNPTDDNREEVIISLKQYCEQICYRFRNRQYHRVVANFSGGESSGLSEIGYNIADIVDKLQIVPGVGVFSSISKLWNATYTYHKSIPKFPRNKESLEVTLPY
ncbi:MAG: hypothetical protein DHS20C12_02050 [Pseudohongiella sp.]|nr:MAG: hypothetical protein DHS20C12_02050 [Pseudohongiella sp.]